MSVSNTATAINTTAAQIAFSYATQRAEVNYFHRQSASTANKLIKAIEANMEERLEWAKEDGEVFDTANVWAFYGDVCQAMTKKFILKQDCPADVLAKIATYQAATK